MLTLHGKVTELVGSRHWGKKPQFLIQVSLEREPSGKTPAERYYCCGFYVTTASAIIAENNRTAGVGCCRSSA